jgi:aromatic-L-amino-acid/L-tryptophan decarboxylase
MLMRNRLSLTDDEIREVTEAASQLASEYYRGLPSRSVFTTCTSSSLRESLREPLPASGASLDSLLETVRDVIFRFSRHNGHPRFFGYVASPGNPIAAAGSMIEAALNSNVTSWRSAPSATELEHVVIDWMKEILGYPPQAAGLLVSGGSMANFAGLAAARSARLPGAVSEGLHGQHLTAYASAEAHFSIRKAASMLGIGESNVRTVPTDALLRMDPKALEAMIEADIEAGCIPFCIAASLGTTGSGAVDPLPAISDIARRRGLWLHVDAAYGGFAALAPSGRPFLEGLSGADSVALDPHKWLYSSVGCGCILYKNPATARAAFSHSADYIDVLGKERDEAFAFWDYGPELSRPFRALSLWLLLKYAGAQAIGEAIESNIACAKRLEALVGASGDFEMLAPVKLSVFCFRYAPPGFDGDLDALNERVLLRLQTDGGSYVSNARIHGKFALRGCVVNYRTTVTDMERLLDDVRAAARHCIG